MENRKGFTLIELLVVIAIIALLLSILIPSLRMAKEHARRLLCMNNLKSIGQGLYVYTENYNQKAIPNGNWDGSETGNPGPAPAYLVGVVADNPRNLKPINLGKLYSEQIIEIPEPFYCPTAAYTTRDSNASQNLMKMYTTNVVDNKHMPPGDSGWGCPDMTLYPDLSGLNSDRCRGGYQYWTWGKDSFSDLSLKPVVVDLVSYTSRIAHKKNDKPYGMNALFGDGHANMTLLSDDLAEALDAAGGSSLGRNEFETVLRLLRP